MKFLDKYPLAKSRSAYKRRTKFLMGYKGKGFAYLSCPYHNELSPSMRVSNGRAYCYGCGESVSYRELGQKLKDKYEKLPMEEQLEFKFWWDQPTTGYQDDDIPF